MALQIDFDCDDPDIDYLQWLNFWDSARSWFAERGYTLYGYHHYWNGEDQGGAPCLVPQISNVEDCGFPFALSGDDGDPASMPVPPLSGMPADNIAFAQDSLNRHVALKIVKECSNEYQISRYLSKEASPSSLEDFQGILPPIEFIDVGKHKIMVTPRWGESPSHPWFSTIREILDFMLYMLKGLSLLHRHNIVHRDIRLTNCLVNHFGAYYNTQNSLFRRKLRRDGFLVYGIIDFGISIKFPSTNLSVDCRLPSNLSFDGNRCQPHDTSQGELDYDPFAFDVGCLGVLFCEKFQHLTRSIPMFAPLMDQMTTRNLDRRFTAIQALQFLEEFTSILTPHELQTLPPCPTYTPYDTYPRWHHLPDGFVREWAHFREPQLPHHTQILRRICDYHWGRKFVQSIRKVYRCGGFVASWLLRSRGVYFSKCLGTSMSSP